MLLDIGLDKDFSGYDPKMQAAKENLTNETVLHESFWGGQGSNKVKKQSTEQEKMPLDYSSNEGVTSKV